MRCGGGKGGVVSCVERAMGWVLVGSLSGLFLTVFLVTGGVGVRLARLK